MTGGKADMRSVEAAADRRSLAIIAAIAVFSSVVNALSVQTEFARGGLSDPYMAWTLELSSNAMLVAVSPLLIWISRRVPLSMETWRRAIPVYLAASVPLSAIHIAGMVWIRKAALGLRGEAYVFISDFWREALYEYRKDLFAFTLLMLIIQGGREIAWLRREAAAAHEDARGKRRLTLKCGGRTIWLEAGDVVWARAAGNYVEVRTATGEHLARATLAGIERLLTEAGVPAVRVHRSYIVNRDKILEAVPTGSGDLVLHMQGGGEAPASRRYREALEAA